MDTAFELCCEACGIHAILPLPGGMGDYCLEVCPDTARIRCLSDGQNPIYKWGWHHDEKPENQNKRKMATAFVIALALTLLCLAMSVIKTHTFNEAVHQAFLCRSGALFCGVCPEQGGNGYGGAQKQYLRQNF